MVLLFAAMLGIDLITIQDLLIKKHTNFFDYSAAGGSVQIDNSDVIQIYLWLSFGLYLVSFVLNKVFKISWRWDFKKKVRLSLLAVLVGYGVPIILSPLFSKVPGTETRDLIIIFSIFAVLSFLASVYAFFITNVVDGVKRLLE